MTFYSSSGIFKTPRIEAKTKLLLDWHIVGVVDLWNTVIVNEYKGCTESRSEDKLSGCF
jgi:hypothetical protein